MGGESKPFTEKINERLQNSKKQIGIFLAGAAMLGIAYSEKANAYETAPLDKTTYYHQADWRWMNYPYHDGTPENNLNPEDDMGWNGCGPTTVAMVISTLKGEKVLPTEIADFYMENGYINNAGATYGSGLMAAPEAYGLESRDIYLNVNEIKETTDSGGMVIINGTDRDPATPATPLGHIFAIRHVTDEGRILVADPLSYEKSQVAYRPEQILYPASRAIAVTEQENAS